MRPSPVLALLCTAAAGILLGAGAATEPQAEDIPQMEQHLRELKQQVADLETRISAAKSATKPATENINDLLNQLPKDLWPVSGESPLKAEARTKWYSENLAGKEIVFKKAGVDTTGSAGKGAYIRTKANATTVVGMKGTLNFYAEFEESEKPNLMQLKNGDTVDLHGTVSRVTSTPAAITVYLKFTTLK
jgi:hypothetical protein